MHTYEVRIYRDGVHVDTQVVTVSDADLARDERSSIAQNSIKAQAMILSRVLFRGALASYEITELS